MTIILEMRPEPRGLPAVGDIIEVPIGALWLPARVTAAPKHGPEETVVSDGCYPGMINFELVGGDLIGGCTRAVQGEFKRSRWRWPGGGR